MKYGRRSHCKPFSTEPEALSPTRQSKLSVARLQKSTCGKIPAAAHGGQKPSGGGVSQQQDNHGSQMPGNTPKTIIIFPFATPGFSKAVIQLTKQSHFCGEICSNQPVFSSNFFKILFYQARNRVFIQYFLLKHSKSKQTVYFLSVPGCNVRFTNLIRLWYRVAVHGKLLWRPKRLGGSDWSRRNLEEAFCVITVKSMAVRCSAFERSLYGHACFRLRKPDDFQPFQVPSSACGNQHGPGRLFLWRKHLKDTNQRLSEHAAPPTAGYREVV